MFSVVEKLVFLTFVPPIVASDERVKEWWMEYKKRLEPRSGEVRHLKIDVLETFGTESFETYFAFFTRLFAQGRSIESVVREYVPRLLPGIWRSALHPSISLGYALQTQNQNAAAYALAYWCYKWAIYDDTVKINCAQVPASLTQSGRQPQTVPSSELGEMPKSLGDLFTSGKSRSKDAKMAQPQKGKESVDVEEQQGFWSILQDMRLEAGEALVNDAPRGFSERLLRVRDNPNFRSALHNGFYRLQEMLNNEYPDSKSMMRWLNSAAFAVFRTTFCREFFLLHIITSLHAMRYIISYVEDEMERRNSLLFFAFCFLAVYMAEGAPKPDVSVQYNLMEASDANKEDWETGRWEKVVNKILGYSDEHAIKIVHVAKWNFEHESDRYLKQLFIDCAETIEANVNQQGNGYCFRPDPEA